MLGRAIIVQKICPFDNWQPTSGVAARVTRGSRPGVIRGVAADMIRAVADGMRRDLGGVTIKGVATRVTRGVAAVETKNLGGVTRWVTAGVTCLRRNGARSVISQRLLM